MSSLSTQSDRPSPEARFPPSYHVYSASTALCLSHTKTRKDQKTVVLDFAKTDGAGRFLWDEKVSFQLDQGELAQLAAVLAYPGLSLTLKHSPNPRTLKTLSVIPQGAKYLFSLASAGLTFHVPVPPSEQFYAKNFLVARIAELSALEPSFILVSLRSLAHQLAPPT